MDLYEIIETVSGHVVDIIPAYTPAMAYRKFVEKRFPAVAPGPADYRTKRIVNHD